jgi:exopolyphosphatase/guanosine-5'-triphosphate,3'-diphosphate pyrophosphatase
LSDLYQVFDDSQQRKTEFYAALDLGSNSFHLVVARVVADAVQVVSKVKHKVRLAEGLDDKNILSDEAIARGITVLESMKETLQGVPRPSIRIVATHTLRRARNARAFIRAARKVFPYPIEIISGNEEARLIFVGIASNSAYSDDRLIFDIGGGSTEFAIGGGTGATQPKICKSIQMGCVSFQQRYFMDGTDSAVISAKNTRQAITAAKIELELAAGNLNKHSWQRTIASSGTARAISSVINIQNARSLDSAINQAELMNLLRQCIDIKHYEDFNFEGLSEDRKPVFVAGLCIMIAIFQSLNIDEVLFSESALREGVLYELQPTHSSQNVRVRTAQSLATRYDIDTQYAHKVLSSCMYIFDHVKDDWALDLPIYRHLLGWAALLHEVGLQINSRGLQKHASYVLLNSEMPGFNQEQQQIIGFLVRFHRKKIKQEDWLTDLSIDTDKVLQILAILRLGVLLNINRHLPTLPEFSIKVDENDIKLGFAQDWYELSPMLLADISRENGYLKHIGMHLTLL